MTCDYRVSFDLSGLAGFADVMRDSLAPALSNAVGKVAGKIAADWQENVLRAGGKGGLYAAERDAYASSIKVEFKPGDLSALVHTPYSQASEIEEGRQPRDLKEMLNTSPKVRLSAKGKRYLVIPFRHNTPGNTAHASAMPKEVFSAAKALNQSRVVGTTMRPSGLIASDPKTRKFLAVTQHVYSWGQRLPAGMAPKLKDHHTSDPYAGMVRMNTSSGKSNSSAYLTFRVMVEGSSKWIIPARPGLFIVRGVEVRGQATANTEFSTAMQSVGAAGMWG